MSPQKKSLSPSTHLVILVSVVTAVWAYWPGWRSLLDAWKSDPDYNHGFLVLPVSAWLLWQRRRELSLLKPEPSWWGAILIAAAGVFNWLSVEYFLNSLSTLSIPIWIAGVVLLFGGWPLLKLSAGPVAFLWFMTPLPGTVALSLSLPLQKISAAVSTWTLNVFGQPAFRQGTLIFLKDEVLNVERACSGLRISYGIMAIASAYIVLCRLNLLRAVVLLFFAVPVAILANSFRVTLTGLLFLVVSGKEAHAYVHDFAGLLMLPLVAFVFWMINRVTERLIGSFGRSRWDGSILILKSCVAIAIIGTGLGLRQTQQAEAAAASLLSAAERYEIAGEKHQANHDGREAYLQWKKAAEFLDRYSSLRPDDAAVAKRLAVAAERLAVNKSGRVRAARAYERAWLLLPEDHELALKQINLALLAEDYETACTAAEKLVSLTKAGSPERFQAFQLLIVAKINDANQLNSGTTWTEVAETLKEGIRQEIDPVTFSYQLAVTYRQHPVDSIDASQRGPEAEKVFAELLTKRPNDPQAWFARYTFHQSFPAVELPANRGDSQHLKAAVSTPFDDLDRAVELAAGTTTPATHALWLAAGKRSIDQKDYTEAAGFFRNAIQSNGRHFLAYLELARLQTHFMDEHAQGVNSSLDQHRRAIAVLKEGLQYAELRDNLDLQFELIRQQFKSQDSDLVAEARREASSLTNRFRSMPASSGVPLILRLALLESQIEEESGNFALAARVLESTLDSKEVRGLQSEGVLLSQAWLLLGGYYEQQGLLLKADECFQKGTSLEPNSVQATLHRALVAERKNNIGIAADLYEDLASRVGTRHEPWIGMARNELRQQLNKSSGQRDFTRLAKALAKAEDLGAPPEAIAVLKSEWRAAEGDNQRALSILETAVAEIPESSVLWRNLAVRRQVDGDIAGADAAQERFSELVKSPTQAAILQSDRSLLAGDSAGARQVLREALQASPLIADQRALHDRLVQIELSGKNLQAVQQLLEQFTQQHPQDIPSLVQLAEFYWSLQRLDLLQSTEQSLHRVEGESGVVWKELKARRLMEQSRQSQEPGESRALLLEATALLETLKQATTNRAKIQILLGRLALQQRRFSDAATHFEAGWNEGINDASLAAELVYALQASGEKERLKVYLEQMQTLVPTSPQLFDLVLAVQGDAGFVGSPLADQAARGWVQSIGDSGSYLRLARTLSLISEQSGAEESETLAFIETAYRRAIELDPSNAEAWGDFLLFLSRRRNDISKMLSELNTFVQDVRVSEFDRCFLVAQLFTQLNYPFQATRFWNSSIKLAEAGENEVNQSRVFAMAASFFASRDEAKALTLARRAVASDPASPDNLRLLTAILSDSNTEASLAEAWSLLDVAKSLNRRETDVDKRIKASILTRRAALMGSETDRATDRRKAAQILSSLEKPSEADFVQLAKISGDLGDRQAALLALSDQARRINADVLTVRAFVEYWQDHFAGTAVLTDRMQQALLTLEKTKDAEIVALDLRLRPTALSGKESYGVVLEFVRRVVLTRPTASEQDVLLRNSFQLLASKRMQDVSLRLLKEDLAPLTDAQKLTALLTVTTQSREDSQFEVALLKVVESHRGSIDDGRFDRAAANYFFFRENWAEAEHFYRRCLQRDPRDAVAGNNLALVVAEHRKDFAEADRLLEQGFAVLAETSNPAGRAILLDTQSQLLLAAGRVDEAFAILEPLSQSATADVSVFLHLAECLRLQNKMAESRMAFAVAQQLGISGGILAPMEKRIYDRLTTVHITQKN